ncbi:hypothetical protein [Chryseobacterium gambrini]|uniref:hypothetical protein n=1 Tax=Chryseobacterium gambrini TaxID=373672 RepID=UPI0022F3B7D7|nr:hypothetical protein [Chryseobacterium gambrini]WBX97524.1 hypothetical protein PE065_22155 [Chryseobacterium gambrini]
MNNTYSHIANWLKSFFCSIELLQFPKELDVDEDFILEGSNREEKSYKEFRRPPNGHIEEPYIKEFEDPILDEAFHLSSEDELLKLIRDTLWEINEFETEIDSSYSKLNSKLEKKEYQYDTQYKK